MSVDYAAEMTIGLDMGVRGQYFKVWYYKRASKITDLWSTRGEYGNIVDAFAEVIWMEDSQSLAFSRMADHFSGTLAKNYYENRMYPSAILTVTSTDPYEIKTFPNTRVISLVMRNVIVDQIIPNNPMPLMDGTEVYLDFVSVIADKATAHQGLDHGQAKTRLLNELLLERREMLEKARSGG